MGLKFSGGLNPLFNSSLPEGPTNQKFLPAGQLNITPRAGTSGSIDDLYDVVITNPVLNDILTYDAAVPAWKNVSLIAGNGLTQTFFQLDKTLTVVAAANGGITVNANGVSVNNTVVRTTGDYTLTGNITINGILTTNNSSNVIDATTLDSQDSTYYRNATNINAGTLAAARLATSGVTASTYGSSTAIPVLTVDDKGRVTVATTTAIVASSETVSGAVRLATAAETNTSTSAALAVSPLNLATYYAKKTSPSLTGTPTAPTAALGNNTTQIATTAFVATATSGLATTASVTAVENSKANIASPSLTGTPSAPTAPAGTNTTQIATTAFVNTAVANYGGLGYNQTWQAVTRNQNQDYVNSTGKPIMLVVNVNRNAVSVSNADVIINGVQVPICRGSNSGGGNYASGSLIIPPGATYRIVNPSEGWSSIYCWELR